MSRVLVWDPRLLVSVYYSRFSVLSSNQVSIVLNLGINFLFRDLNSYLMSNVQDLDSKIIIKGPKFLLNVKSYRFFDVSSTFRKFQIWSLMFLLRVQSLMFAVQSSRFRSKVLNLKFKNVKISCLGSTALSFGLLFQIQRPKFE